MVFILKGENATHDQRLDRLVQFDDRSRNYSIADTRTAAKKHRSYTWRCDATFDQGMEGACVGFALGHELAARPAEVRDLTSKFLREQIYWEAQKIDPWAGGAYPGANPRYEGTSVLAGIKVVKKLGYIDEYRWAFNMDDLMYGIGHNGPALLGIPWYYNMYFPNKAGVIVPTGMMVGGHAILARAINLKTGMITLRNSWGPLWGVGGDCYIKIDHLQYLLEKDGECAFLMKRRSNPKV